MRPGVSARLNSRKGTNSQRRRIRGTPTVAPTHALAATARPTATSQGKRGPARGAPAAYRTACRVGGARGGGAAFRLHGGTANGRVSTAVTSAARSTARGEPLAAQAGRSSTMAAAKAISTARSAEGAAGTFPNNPKEVS